MKNFYLQGMDNLARNFDAAGTMFRKSLDAAMKHLDPTGKGTLEKRIDSLDPAIGVTALCAGRMRIFGQLNLELTDDGRVLTVNPDRRDRLWFACAARAVQATLANQGETRRVLTVVMWKPKVR